MPQWYNEKDIKINNKSLIKMPNLHGYVLPHAGTIHTKKVINHTLRFIPSKQFNSIYILYYPAYNTENISINGKKYYHEYYVIYKIMKYVLSNVWKIPNIVFKPVNVRDTSHHILNSLKYDPNAIYIVSADFSHHKPFQQAHRLENCAAHSILHRALDNKKTCNREIDHIDSFNLLYKILPLNHMLQWIGRSRSSGEKGVGYLSFLIRSPIIRKADGFFVTAFDINMRKRECLGNVNHWNKILENDLIRNVLHKAKTTSRLTSGKYINDPVKYYTVTYLYKETPYKEFIRGYHAIMTSALYLPDVFLENTYENGKWITSNDKEWKHNGQQFNMFETLQKLNNKGGRESNNIVLFATKEKHFTL